MNEPISHAPYRYQDDQVGMTEVAVSSNPRRPFGDLAPSSLAMRESDPIPMRS